MEIIKKIRTNPKKVLEDITKFYIVLGCLYGLSDCHTTGHLSVDLYLGKKQPTYLEKILINEASKICGEKLPEWIEKRK